MGFKDFPGIPQPLMPVVGLFALELFLMRKQPLIGVVLVLRLLAFVLLLVGAIVGVKVGLLREAVSLLFHRGKHPPLR